MARVLRIQKQILLLVTTFLLSSVYRTVREIWPWGPHSTKTHAGGRNTNQSLLVCLGPGPLDDARPNYYSLELNGSFPFVHIQSTALKAVPITLSHAPYLSGMAGLSDLYAMQIAQGQGACVSGGGGDGGGGKGVSLTGSTVFVGITPVSTSITWTEVQVPHYDSAEDTNKTGDPNAINTVATELPGNGQTATTSPGSTQQTPAPSNGSASPGASAGGPSPSGSYGQSSNCAGSCYSPSGPGAGL